MPRFLDIHDGAYSSPGELHIIRHGGQDGRYDITFPFAHEIFVRATLLFISLMASFRLLRAFSLLSFHDF